MQPIFLKVFFTAPTSFLNGQVPERHGYQAPVTLDFSRIHFDGKEVSRTHKVLVGKASSVENQGGETVRRSVERVNDAFHSLFGEASVQNVVDNQEVFAAVQLLAKVVLPF